MASFHLEERSWLTVRVFGKKAHSRIEFRKLALYLCKRKAHPQSDYVLRVFYSLDMVTTLYFPSHAMHVHMCTFSVSVAAASNLALALYGSDWEQQTPSYCKSS